MRKAAITFAALFALALAAPALAQACVPSDASPEQCVYRIGLAPLPCNRTLGQILGVAFYGDNDFCQPDCVFSVWVYEETNGRFWLQRNDPMMDNTCGGAIDSDTIVF